MAFENGVSPEGEILNSFKAHAQRVAGIDDLRQSFRLLHQRRFRVTPEHPDQNFDVKFLTNFAVRISKERTKEQTQLSNADIPVRLRTERCFSSRRTDPDRALNVPHSCPVHCRDLRDHTLIGTRIRIVSQFPRLINRIN